MEDLTKYGGFSEAIVAVAGPIVSGLIVLLSLPFVGEYDFFALSFKLNAGLFFLNLLPALPMDGGRIVRNLLLLFVSFKEATMLMVYAGRAIALIFVGYNVYLAQNGSTSFVYVLTGIFIYVGTVKEVKFHSYYYLLNKNNQKLLRIKQHKIRYRIVEVHEDTPIRFAAGRFSPGNVCLIHVLDDNGKVIKILKEADIMNAFLTYGYDSKVGSITKK